MRETSCETEPRVKREYNNIFECIFCSEEAAHDVYKKRKEIRDLYLRGVSENSDGGLETKVEETIFCALQRVAKNGAKRSKPNVEKAEKMESVEPWRPVATLSAWEENFEPQKKTNTLPGRYSAAFAKTIVSILGRS